MIWVPKNRNWNYGFSPTLAGNLITLLNTWLLSLKKREPHTAMVLSVCEQKYCENKYICVWFSLYMQRVSCSVEYIDVWGWVNTHKIIVETAAYFVPEMLNKRAINFHQQLLHAILPSSVLFTKGCLDNHDFPWKKECWQVDRLKANRTAAEIAPT
jgi:hypothetical protein